MLSVKKILSFLFFVCYNLYAFSAVPPAPTLGPNVRMEAALNVPIAAIAGVPFAHANLFDPVLAGGRAVGAAAIAVAGVNVGPLGAVPAQIDVHSDTVAVDKFISYCHNASLGHFDPAAAAAAAAGVAPLAAVPGLQINALINRLREFYSTDINDLTELISTIGGWSPMTLPHFSLAAVTIISRTAVAGQYDYRTFFFGDIFRSGQGILKPGINNNPLLPGILLHAIGQGLPAFVPPVPPFISAIGAARLAHSERAFEQFLTNAPPAGGGVHPAAPVDSRANLITLGINPQDILAFVIHLKNKLRMCSICRNNVVAHISNHFLGLLIDPAGLTISNSLFVAYDPLLKGNYLTAGLIAHNASATVAANSVFAPIVAGVPIPAANPLPGAAGAILLAGDQTVRIIFIIGSNFKDVDTFE